MPLLSFSVLRDKLDDETKLRTTRVKGKRPKKVGDHLRIWWKSRTKYREFLGTGIITDIVEKTWQEFTPEDAYADGFDCLYDFLTTIFMLHKVKSKTFDPAIQLPVFQLITWKWIRHIGKPIQTQLTGEPKDAL